MPELPQQRGRRPPRSRTTGRPRTPRAPARRATPARSRSTPTPVPRRTPTSRAPAARAPAPAATTPATCPRSERVTTVNTNIHTSCLRCHDRTATASERGLQPGQRHVRLGSRVPRARQASTTPTTFVHNGATGAGLADGDDAAHHTAQRRLHGQRTENSGTATNVCSDCHIGTLASEHATTGPCGLADQGRLHHGRLRGQHRRLPQHHHRHHRRRLGRPGQGELDQRHCARTATPPSTTPSPRATPARRRSPAARPVPAATPPTTWLRCTRTARAAAAAGSPAVTIRPQERAPSNKTCGHPTVPPSTPLPTRTTPLTARRRRSGTTGTPGDHDATGMRPVLGGYTQSALCTNCHSTTALNTCAQLRDEACHRVVLDRTAPSDTGCHNPPPRSTWPRSSRAGNWSKPDLQGLPHHNQTVHVDGGAVDAPAVTAPRLHPARNSSGGSHRRSFTSCTRIHQAARRPVRTARTGTPVAITPPTKDPGQVSCGGAAATPAPATPATSSRTTRVRRRRRTGLLRLPQLTRLDGGRTKRRDPAASVHHVMGSTSPPATSPPTRARIRPPPRTSTAPAATPTTTTSTRTRVPTYAQTSPTRAVRRR